MPEPFHVPHFHGACSPLVRLFEVGGAQRLEHVITGENVLVQRTASGNPWTLEADGEWGKLTAPDVPAVWVNDILNSTLWRYGGNLYVETRADRMSTEAVSKVWLSDLRHEHDREYASWRGAPEYPTMTRLELLRLHIPRDSATVFFNVRDVQSCLQLVARYGGKAAWIAKSTSAWSRVLEANCVPISHLYNPSTGGSATTLRRDETFASAYALPLILAYGANAMHDQGDRQSCRDCLQGIVKNLSGVFSFHVKLRDFMGAMEVATCGAQVTFFDGVVRVDRTHDRLLNSIEGKPIAVALVDLFAKKAAASWLFAALVGGLARAIEHHLEGHRWPTDPLTCLTQAGTVRRVNRHVKQALIDLPITVVRNSYRAAAFGKKLGLPFGCHASWMDKQYMKRYYWAFRETVNGLSWSYTCDKSRGSGRDWLVGTAGTYESKRFGWCQPVVPRADPHPEIH